MQNQKWQRRKYFFENYKRRTTAASFFSYLRCRHHLFPLYSSTARNDSSVFGIIYRLLLFYSSTTCWFPYRDSPTCPPSICHSVCLFSVWPCCASTCVCASVCAHFALVCAVVYCVTVRENPSSIHLTIRPSIYSSRWWSARRVG